MAARVDTRAMLVRDGAMAIAFAVDCGAGTATLDPEGEPHAVRLLCWREKCALARFAVAGAGFLEAQFVATSGGAPPDDPVRREALSALAFWLHGAEPLPFDAALLAEATLGLCGALGIGPAELGALPAPEVEALWHARGGAETERRGAASALNGVSGMSCIVIEPDPVEGLASIVPGGAAPQSMQPTEAPLRDVHGEPGGRARAAPRAGVGAEPTAVPIRHEHPAGDPPGRPVGSRDFDPPRERQVSGAPHPRKPNATLISGEDRSPQWGSASASARAAARFRVMPAHEPTPEADPAIPHLMNPGEGRVPASVDQQRHSAIPSRSKPGPGLRRGGALRLNRSNAAERVPVRPDENPGEATDREGNAVRLATDRSSPIAHAPMHAPMGAAAVRDAPSPDGRATTPIAAAQNPHAPPTPAAAAISAMISAVAPPGFSGRASRAPSPASTRPTPPILATAPGPASAIDSRLGALVEIVGRAAVPRPDAAESDALVDSFGDRLAEAVAELGLAGAE